MFYQFEYSHLYCDGLELHSLNQLCFHGIDLNYDTCFYFLVVFNKRSYSQIILTSEKF